MKKLTLLIPIAAVLMTGCGSVLSISPLYTDENVVQDPGLTGTWLADQDNDIVVVRQVDGKAYQVFYTSMRDAAVTMKFEVQLVQLKDFRFLDIVRDTGGWTIPGHSFAKISLEGDRAKISFLDSDWLKEQILAERPAVGLKRGELLVLPDNTAFLQQIASKYAGEPRAFGGGLELRRIHQ
jgi:hypothetical protein